MDGGLSSPPLAPDAPRIGSTGRHPLLVCSTRRVATLHNTARQLLRHHLRPGGHRHHRHARRPLLRAHHLLRSRQQLPPAQRGLPLLPDGHQHLQRPPQPRRAHPRHCPRVVLLRGYRRQQRNLHPQRAQRPGHRLPRPHPDHLSQPPHIQHQLLHRDCGHRGRHAARDNAACPPHRRRRRRKHYLLQPQPRPDLPRPLLQPLRQRPPLQHRHPHHQTRRRQQHRRPRRAHRQCRPRGRTDTPRQPDRPSLRGPQQFLQHLLAQPTPLLVQHLHLPHAGQHHRHRQRRPPLAHPTGLLPLLPALGSRHAHRGQQPHSRLPDHHLRLRNGRHHAPPPRMHRLPPRRAQSAFGHQPTAQAGHRRRNRTQSPFHPQREPHAGLLVPDRPRRPDPLLQPSLRRHTDGQHHLRRKQCRTVPDGHHRPHLQRRRQLHLRLLLRLRPGLLRTPPHGHRPVFRLRRRLHLRRTQHRQPDPHGPRRIRTHGAALRHSRRRTPPLRPLPPQRRRHRQLPQPPVRLRRHHLPTLQHPHRPPLLRRLRLLPLWRGQHARLLDRLQHPQHRQRTLPPHHPRIPPLRQPELRIPYHEQQPLLRHPSRLRRRLHTAAQPLLLRPHQTLRTRPTRHGRPLRLHRHQHLHSPRHPEHLPPPVATRHLLLQPLPRPRPARRHARHPAAGLHVRQHLHRRLRRRTLAAALHPRLLPILRHRHSRPRPKRRLLDRVRRPRIPSRRRPLHHRPHHLQPLRRHRPPALNHLRHLCLPLPRRQHPRP